MLFEECGYFVLDLPRRSDIVLQLRFRFDHRLYM